MIVVSYMDSLIAALSCENEEPSLAGIRVLFVDGNRTCRAVITKFFFFFLI